MKPSISRDVHYVSYGTPGGEYPSVCRTAKVTEVDPNDPARVGLVVLNPTGFFFHPLSDGGSYHNEVDHVGGTWHWPERVDGATSDAAFVARLLDDRTRLVNMLDEAWRIIANAMNVSTFDAKEEVVLFEPVPGWNEVAKRFRDERYHPWIDELQRRSAAPGESR